MELRPELMPPPLDLALVARLSKLAADLDGAQSDRSDALAEFNRLAGTSLPLDKFRDIYETENYEDFVRRMLYHQLIRPATDVTTTELVEVVRRAMPTNEFFGQHEAYMAIFDANVPMAGASILIFCPPDDDAGVISVGRGHALSDYNPTPEQIVEWALLRGVVKQDARRGITH